MGNRSSHETSPKIVQPEPKQEPNQGDPLQDLQRAMGFASTAQEIVKDLSKKKGFSIQNIISTGQKFLRLMGGENNQSSSSSPSPSSFGRRRRRRSSKKLKRRQSRKKRTSKKVSNRPLRKTRRSKR